MFQIHCSLYIYTLPHIECICSRFIQYGNEKTHGLGHLWPQTFLLQGGLYSLSLNKGWESLRILPGDGSGNSDYTFIIVAFKTYACTMNSSLLSFIHVYILEQTKWHYTHHYQPPAHSSLQPTPVCWHLFVVWLLWIHNHVCLWFIPFMNLLSQLTRPCEWWKQYLKKVLEICIPFLCM